MVNKILRFIIGFLMFVLTVIASLLLIADINVNISLADFNKIFVIKTLAAVMLYVLVYILSKVNSLLERRYNDKKEL